jgi:hypothetical protein
MEDDKAELQFLNNYFNPVLREQADEALPHAHERVLCQNTQFLFTNQAFPYDDERRRMAAEGWRQYSEWIVAGSRAHTRAIEISSVDLAELSGALGQVEHAHFGVKQDLHKAYKNVRDSYESLQAVFEEHKELSAAQAKYNKSLKSHLAIKPGKDEKASAFFPADNAIFNTAKALEMRHFDCESNVINWNESLPIIRLQHLHQSLTAHLRGCRAGLSLLEPLEGKLSRLLSTIQTEQNSLLIQSDRREIMRQLVEKKINADQAAIDTLRSGDRGTGIRDFDTSASLSTASEFTGVLFTPPPDVSRLICTIARGNFIAKGPTGELHTSIPTALATVKEVRDSPYRFVFSVISPMKTLTLQATNLLEMRRWIDIIQNAIRAGLDSDTGRGGEKTAAEAKRAGSLKLLWELPGNRACCDCGRDDPDWISTNLGITLCVDCAGAHRSLGVHLTKVRSATLDDLDPFLLSYMAAMGNVKSNQVWLSGLLPGTAIPTTESARGDKAQFVQSKYARRAFVHTPAETNASPSAQLWAVVRACGQPHETMRLVALGADVNARDGGQSLLHFAVQSNQSLLIEFLLQQSADCFAVDTVGDTPLHVAARLGLTECVTHLLLRGGTRLVLVNNADGKNALEVAHSRTDSPSELTEILSKAMTKQDKNKRDTLVSNKVSSP